MMEDAAGESDAPLNDRTLDQTDRRSSGRALTLLAEFAPAMRAIHGAGEVAKTLRSICGHSRTYFNADALRHSEFAQRAFARRIGELPYFIDSFALLLPQA